MITSLGGRPHVSDSPFKETTGKAHEIYYIATMKLRENSVEIGEIRLGQ